MVKRSSIKSKRSTPRRKRSSQKGGNVTAAAENNEQHNQVGGELQISDATMQQAKGIAEGLLKNMGAAQNNQAQSNQPQFGGSAAVAAASPLSASMNGGTAPVAPVVPVAPVTGASELAHTVAGAAAGQVVAHEPFSGLQGSPIMGGGNIRNQRNQRNQQQKQQKQQQQQQNNQNNQQNNQNNQQNNQNNQQNNQNNQEANQNGGMIPGVMAAVETALVPLGLYLGQKALQSRSGRFSSKRQSRNRFFRSSRRRGSRNAKGRN